MKNIFYLLLTTVFINSCIAQDAPEAPKDVPEAFQSCCGTQAVNFTYGKANVYVPNVFTPNGDGVNDLFMPYINEGVKAVVEFTILSINKDTVLFHQRDIVLKDLKTYAWNGKRYDGKQHSGPFKYGMAVYDNNGVLGIVEGEACAIPCSKEMEVFKTKEGCYYPVQAGKNGTVDKSIASAEKTCF